MLAAAHVVVHFLDYALLRSSKWKLEEILIEIIEIVAHVGKHMPWHLCIAALDVLEDIHLQEEQLLKLQSPLSLLQQWYTLWLMYVDKRLAQRHELVFVDYAFRQGLFYVLHRRGFEQLAHNFLHSACGKRAIVHLLGEVIHTYKASVHYLGFKEIDLGVGHVVMTLIDGGFAKENILHTSVVAFHY